MTSWIRKLVAATLCIVAVGMWLNAVQQAVSADDIGARKIVSYIPTIWQDSSGFARPSFYNKGFARALNGDPADSLAGASAETTTVIPILGARSVTIFYRDSIVNGNVFKGPSAGTTGYLDSVIVKVQFTNILSKSTSKTFNDSGAVWTAQLQSTQDWTKAAAMGTDTLGVWASGKMTSIPLAPFATTNGGYYFVNLYPGNANTETIGPNVSLGFKHRFMRLIFSTDTRKRAVGSTENAALLGLRCRVHVWYDGPNPVIKPGYE